MPVLAGQRETLRENHTARRDKLLQCWRVQSGPCVDMGSSGRLAAAFLIGVTSPRLFLQDNELSRHLPLTPVPGLVWVPTWQEYSPVGSGPTTGALKAFLEDKQACGCPHPTSPWPMPAGTMSPIL